MTTAEIIQIQHKIGTDTDGFFGPASRAAVINYLKRMMPRPHPWPEPRPDHMRMFYGVAGDEDNLVIIDGVPGLLYDGTPVRSVRVHRKAADSLSRILTAASVAGYSEMLAGYQGCFNDRLKRGGTTKSIHAWGAAIDLGVPTNAFKDSWPLTSNMPLGLMEIFAKEGWVPAGAFWGYDAQHFQATATK